VRVRVGRTLLYNTVLYILRWVDAVALYAAAVAGRAVRPSKRGRASARARAYSFVYYTIYAAAATEDDDRRV